MREGADPQALIELRRFLGRPFALHKVEAAAFDRLLSDLYASGADAAADAAGSLGFDDLGHLASALPTADDLLDTSDDAPAIRLINGIIGELFKTRSGTKEKRNLMVFIRPTILRSADDARAMSARRYGYARGQQLLSNPNREPTLDELVRDYLGTVPPNVPAERQPQDAVLAPAETVPPASPPVQVPPQ